MLKRFRLTKFLFKIRTHEKINLSPIKSFGDRSFYSGSTFRGGFGYAFRRVACVTRNKDCFDCLLREKCVYSYIFETPVPADAKIMKKYTFAPHPFIIEPPLASESEGESEVKFGLILIGKAIDYLPYFIYTFDELGKIGIGKDRKKFEIVEVKCFLTNTLIYKNNEKKLINNYRILKFEDLKTEEDKIKDRLKINFLTPLRIKFAEKLTDEIEFHIIIRNLLRRISLLSYFHCDEELNINFKELCSTAQKIKIKDQNLRWYDLERYSSRQKARIKMGGVIGRVEYEGDIKEFLPYLILGEYIHLGKNCTFGLGKYELERRGENA